MFKALKIVDAPGSPTFGESCAPWVFDLAASIFGAYDQESGRRLITEWFVCIPKKSSKSTVAAAVMLTALVLNWRQSAEFAILAPTIEVASNSFSPARDMVRADDELSALVHVQPHIKTLTHRESNATLKVIAADSATVGGKKSVGTLIDEVWLLGKQPNAESMLVEALGGLASRPEGFVIYLTTQSDDPPAGVFRKKLQYARDVRDGKIKDPRFVPVIYEFPADMIARNEHLNPEVFRMVNPNLGYSVDEEFLRREFVKAQDGGPDSLRGFLAKHLNVEIGLALRSDRWTGADLWQSAGRALTLDAIIEQSDVLTMGIDGGGLDDLLGACVMGRHAETGQWMAWGRAWAHPIVLERRKSEAARLRDMHKAGDLMIVERVGDDMNDLALLATRLEASGKLASIGVDPAGISDIETMLRDECDINEDDDGKDRIVGISQGWKLTGIIKTCERRLAEHDPGKQLVHGNQPLMAWCVGNAKVEPRGNAVLITKAASGTGKIDPLMAMFNAATIMALVPELNICTDDEVLAA